MTIDTFRTFMTDTWRRIERDAQDSRDSNQATLEFADWYDGLGSTERSFADQVLAEWAHSEDEAKQFDALATIRRFKVVSAVPSLQRLESQLVLDTSAPAPFLRSKVRQLIQFLTTGPDTLPPTR